MKQLELFENKKEFPENVFYWIKTFLTLQGLQEKNNLTDYKKMLKCLKKIQ